MLIRRIEKFINIEKLKEDARKLGVNFITAGIAGVFLNHFEGIKTSAMLWSAMWVVSIGVFFLTFGLKRGKQ
jgi:hypothetical protein